MNTHLISVHFHPVFPALFGSAFILGLVACSASDEPSFGARIESPAKVNPPLSATPTSSSPPPTSSEPPMAHPGPPYPTGTGPWPAPPFSKPLIYIGPWPPKPSTWWDFKLSPLEKLILDICPEQVWSQNVPDVACKMDDECGDGFCDRGHCNAIWTCRVRSGMPCITHEHCLGSSIGLCIDGRCRSCKTHDECEAAHPGKGLVCNVRQRPPYPRLCGVLGPHSRKSDFKEN